ncbi:MAG: DMT family transporter [Deltaproteobacteria bacterium]|jgi:drug/metabolite transporter (DMT)-like permease|nr:DMT family transporter [Deltaproteobacteria bacterium]
MSVKTKAFLLLVTATIIWGVSSPLNRYALMNIHPWSFSAFRYLFGTVALLPLALRLGHRQAPANYYFDQVSRLEWLKAGLCLGVLLTLGSCFQFFGLTITTASKSSFITSLYVSMVALFGFVLGQIPRLKVWIGLFLCMIGLAFIGNVGGESSFNRGDALTLIADLLWATHMMTMGYFAIRVNPWKLVASQSAVCSLISFGVAYWTDTLPTMAQFGKVWPILAWGIMSVSVAYVCQAMAQINSSPTATAVIMQFQPILGATCGVIFLNEKVSLPMVIGAVFLITGALIAQRAGDCFRLERGHPKFRLVMVARFLVGISILSACGLSMVLTAA